MKHIGTLFIIALFVYACNSENDYPRKFEFDEFIVLDTELYLVNPDSSLRIISEINHLTAEDYNRFKNELLNANAEMFVIFRNIELLDSETARFRLDSGEEVEVPYRIDSDRIIFDYDGEELVVVHPSDDIINISCYISIWHVGAFSGNPLLEGSQIPDYNIINEFLNTNELMIDHLENRQNSYFPLDSFIISPILLRYRN